MATISPVIQELREEIQKKVDEVKRELTSLYCSEDWEKIYLKELKDLIDKIFFGGGKEE